MNRTDFIKNIFGVGLFGFLVPFSGKQTQQKETEIDIYESYVRGLVYTKGRHYVSKMKPGDPLLMKREPDNPYDRSAIALYYDNIKIGYVPAEDNYFLSNMLDAGHGRFYACIKEISPGKPHWEQVLFCIKSVG